MGRIAAAVAISLLLSAPATAAGPRSMVLEQGDVPRSYWRDESFAMPRVPYWETVAKPFRRFGFASGYYTTFRDTSPPYWRTIYSVAFVFRTENGARKAIAYLARGGPPPIPVRLASGGLLQVEGDAVILMWRRGRVVAAVNCDRVPRPRDAARRLARTQDRRIAAALR